MKYELIQMNELKMSGFVFYGDPFSTRAGWDGENEIGKLWKRFITYVTSEEKNFKMSGSFIYEVHIYNIDTKDTGNFEVFVGAPALSERISYELSTKHFEASQYLHFTLTGPEIMSDWWQTLDTQILPELKLKKSYPYILQRYDERFKGINEINASEMEVLIPVEEMAT